MGDYLYGFGTLGLRETLYSVGGDSINVIPVGTGGQLYNNGLTLGPVGDGGFHSREMIYGNSGVGTEIREDLQPRLAGDHAAQAHDRAIRDLRLCSVD